MSGQEKERKIKYDLLRILAAFSVVMLHSAAQLWYDYPVQSRTWLILNSQDAIVRFGVPVFVMISGAIFLSGEGPIDVGRLYRHNILRLAVIYMLWSLLYGLWDLSKYEGSAVDAKVFINEWVGGRYHLWFLPMMIGIYMVVPILHTWVHHASKKELQYFLLLFVLLQIGRESLRVAVLKTPFAISLINTTRVEIVCSYLGYFILGHYIARFGLPGKLHKYIYGMGVLGAVANIILGNAIALRTGERRGDAYDSFTVFTFCMVVAIFLVFETKADSWKLFPGARKLLTAVSMDTLGVYLMHVGIMEWINPLKWEWFGRYAIVTVPLLAIVCFAVSVPVAGLLRRIPFVGRYLC